MSSMIERLIIQVRRDFPTKKFFIDWKRENSLAIRVLTKRSPYDAEKGFNRTFSNKCKDAGVAQQDKGLADISLTTNDCLIIECSVDTVNQPLNFSFETTRPLKVILPTILD